MSDPTVHTVSTERHTTAYLRAGDPDGPLLVFVHGWPERSFSWRHQIRHFAARGYDVVAPDMRGYGSSTVHPDHGDYTVEQAATDMLELIEALGRDRAVWVGHDWGSPVVWALAAHHRDRCRAVASLCVPYMPDGFTLDSIVPLVDRTVYPADEFPAGQWEYWLYYREHFERAAAVFEADVSATIRTLFRSGSPDGLGQPSLLASTRQHGGWFFGMDAAPDLPIDGAVLDADSLQGYVDGLTANGFGGPDSWYMNDPANGEYAMGGAHRDRLELPVLFLHARFDTVCETLTSRLAEPMRATCPDLTEVVVDSGHWMQQEQPAAVNAALAAWLEAIG